jgi:hypothetical protein
VYAQKATAGDEEAIKILRGTSPVAWQHINFSASLILIANVAGSMTSTVVNMSAMV